MFDFYYQHSGNRRKSFKVKGEVCTIGSARSNDLVLETKAMAKRHVELRLTAAGVHITDLGSMSGTWVNKERVSDYGPLSDLDEIVVGDVSVVLDGMPVIGDDFIGRPSGELLDQSSNVDDDYFEEKPKRGGFFSFLKSDLDDDDEIEEEVKPVAKVRAKRKGSIREDHIDSEASVNGHAINGGANNGTSTADRTDSESLTRTDDNTVINGANSNHSSHAKAINATNEGQHNGVNGTASTIAAPLETPVVEPEPEELDEAQIEQDNEMARWSRIVHDQLLNQMDLRRKDVNRMSDDQLREESEALINQIITKLAKQIPDDIDTDILRQHVLNEAVGLGPLEQFLEDDDVTEIMVNNYEEIFVEKGGRIVKSKYQFSSDATVYSVIERIITPIGRRIDESSPIVDARLKDGSRVNAVIPPLALKGPSLTIRKFPKHRMQFSDLVKFGSTSQQMVDFFQICVESHKNIIVAGGTGSGKTTLLNVLSNFIPDADRIVTIEDAAELKLVQPNLVSLESRPPNLEGKGDVSIRDLVKNSLRMRPDRVVIGECRGGEAIDMLQAMNTGHDGSLTTIHANTPRDVISRLEVLVLMAGMDLPVTAIREQVASAVHLIVQQSRFPCGSRKITKVTEVVGVESGTVQLQDIFEFKQNGLGEDGKVRGVFRPTGFIPTFYDDLRAMGLEVDISVFDNSRALEA